MQKRAASGFEAAHDGQLAIDLSVRGAGRATVGPRPEDRYSANRRKTATAFWPPKPKPLIIAVSTRTRRLTSGT